MQTDARELSDREVHELEGMGAEFDRKQSKGESLSSRDYINFLRRRLEAKYQQHSIKNHDPRLTTALKWIAATASIAVGGGLTTIIVMISGLMGDVRVLKDRPEGIPKEEFSRYVQSQEDRANAQDRRLDAIESSLRNTNGR